MTPNILENTHPNSQKLRESQFKNQWKICFTNFQRFFMKVSPDAKNLNQEKTLIQQFQADLKKKSKNPVLFQKIQQWIKKEKLNSKKAFLHALKDKDESFKKFIFGSLHIFLGNLFYQKIVAKIYPEKNIQQNERLLRKFLDDNDGHPFPQLEERVHEQKKEKTFQQDITEQQKQQGIFNETLNNQQKLDQNQNLNTLQQSSMEQQQIIKQMSQFFDPNNFNHLDQWQGGSTPFTIHQTLDVDEQDLQNFEFPNNNNNTEKCDSKIILSIYEKQSSQNSEQNFHFNDENADYIKEKLTQELLFNSEQQQQPQTNSQKPQALPQVIPKKVYQEGDKTFCQATIKDANNQEYDVSFLLPNNSIQQQQDSEANQFQVDNLDSQSLHSEELGIQIELDSFNHDEENQEIQQEPLFPEFKLETENTEIQIKINKKESSFNFSQHFPQQRKLSIDNNNTNNNKKSNLKKEKQKQIKKQEIFSETDLPHDQEDEQFDIEQQNPNIKLGLSSHSKCFQSQKSYHIHPQQNLSRDICQECKNGQVCVCSSYFISNQYSNENHRKLSDDFQSIYFGGTENNYQNNNNNNISILFTLESTP